MLIQISDILEPAMREALLDLAGRPDLFREGSATAGWHAKARKKNLQAKPDGEVAGALKTVEERLLAHDLFRAVARPKRLVGVMLSRYEPGMEYGAHVDDALMQGSRTDVSFTLFLNGPDAYEGGGLVIDETAGERRIRGEAGSAVLYPSTTLHRVEPVTAGARIAVVGWVRSYVRDAGRREMLFDLDRAVADLRGTGAAGEALDLILKTRSNLLRLWAED
jgi:PKHD-type hydroxylase